MILSFETTWASPDGDEHLYAIYRNTAGLVWNGSAMVAWVDANVAAYDVAATYAGGNLYIHTIPTDLPAGSTYSSIPRRRAGATPATTDDEVGDKYRFTWNGTEAVEPGDPGTIGTNLYCNTTTFLELYDLRQMGMLLRDDNLRAINTAAATRLQLLLNMMADKLDSYLAGRYTLPLPYSIVDGNMPGALSLWVAAKTAERLFQRRSDLPAQVKDDVKQSDDWLKELISGVVSIVGRDGVQLGRSTIATLDSSDYTDGRSQFDARPNIFPRASSTSPSRGL